MDRNAYVYYKQSTKKHTGKAIIVDKALPSIDETERTTLTLTELVGGWIGGISGIIASHPMDTIKVVHQNGYTSFFQSIFVIYKTSGVGGYFRGISVPAAMAGIQNAIFFGVYANSLREIKHYIKDPNKDSTRIFIAGNMGGIGQVVLTTPVEVIKVQLQTSQLRKGHSKIFKTLKSIIKYRGLYGFYHGFIPTAFRDVPSGGIQFLIYTNTDHYLQQYIHSYWSHMISGGLSGCLSYAPMTPFDFVKTRLQADNLKDPRYLGVIDCVRKSYKQVGVTGFWRGFLMSSFRSFTSNAVLFVVYEFCVN